MLSQLHIRLRATWNQPASRQQTKNKNIQKKMKETTFVIDLASFGFPQKMT
jgi:hypothetical protein